MRLEGPKETGCKNLMFPFQSPPFDSELIDYSDF
jgi:hypothetical protein